MKILGLFAVLLTIPAFVSPALGQSNPLPVVKTLCDSPNEFYTKYLDADGIAVRAAGCVDDLALQIARGKINRMLAAMPAVRNNLRHNGAELHIIGRKQLTSDLPEFRAHKGEKYLDRGMLTDIDQRARGTGGLLATCGEENLLGLPEDRYQGQYDVCTHEFAHTILDFGLDAATREKVAACYRESLASGKWKGAYAATDLGEYFAELTLWYFGGHGAFVPGTRLPAAGQAGLRDFDPQAFQLVEGIYSGKISPRWIPVSVARKTSPGQRSGYGTERSDLTIVNNTGERLKAFWIAFDGERKETASIPAYGRMSFDTMASHVWMIGTDSGKVLGYYRAGAGKCEIRL